MIVGIDPGKSGGIAVIDGKGRFVDGTRMPLLKHGNRDVVNITELNGFVLEALGPRARTRRRGTIIVIEAVHAMPAQGVSSTFNFGRHTGAVEGWAVGSGCRLTWVTPQKWKKHFTLTKDKRASLDRARLEFGEDKRWSVLANDGIAEAALIALWRHQQS